MLSDVTPHASTLLPGPGIRIAVAPSKIPNDRLVDHLSSKRQYGTEISKPLSPIYIIYEYDYEYEYEKDYVKLCGEISWLISTKLRAYPHYLCLGFVD